MHISRRYVKKFGIPDPADEVTGYETFDEVCRDLEEVVDVLWFSGTPSLQVPYLLNVALAVNTYLASFPPAPRPTFNLLRKVDHCFASLLVGYDVKTKDPLPGFSSTVGGGARSRFSRTDMVRCKSLADETRMLVAMVMSGEVDVVDYAEDDITIRRPARARSEALHESLEASTSTPQGFPEVETVKSEEMNYENPGLDFSSSDEEPTSPVKRKADEIVEDITMTDDVAQSKRVKVEDEGDHSVNFGSIEPVGTSSNPPPTSKNPKDDKKGQFHWALEEDDDSDDEGQPDSSSSIIKARDSTIVGGVLPSPPDPPDPDNIVGEGYEIDNSNANDEGEEIIEYEEYEDEDEDEELQMNVGKVYEKTLVQLGQSLGESIVDD
ncbi:hypothetical protein NUW58_g4781 [Xylaria curta]|uniref:Uncharacterized protein n=1 Tax=Xylaria curta TaxID=42375 RepID=A0ACC1P763_9PEZI|nr:hypothetical protein NUW58_g4781 [Xylaria curta]